MKIKVDIDEVKNMFERIKKSCSNLSFNMQTKWADKVSLFMGLDRQNHLSEPVSIYLSDDCLNMCCGDDFWIEAFPCTDKKISEEFERNVIGFLSGKNKVIKRYRNGTYIGGSMVTVNDATTHNLYGQTCINVEFFCFWRSIEYKTVSIST